MKIKPEYLLLAEYSLLSERKPTLVNIFSSIDSASFPTILPNLTVAASFSVLKPKGGETLDVTISFVPSQDSNLEKQTQSTPRTIPKDYKGDTYSVGTLVQIPGGMAFDVPGVYIFELLVDGKVIDKKEFKVNKSE